MYLQFQNYSFRWCPALQRKQFYKDPTRNFLSMFNSEYTVRFADVH